MLCAMEILKTELIGFIGARLLGAFSASLRWKRLGFNHLPEKWQAQDPVIICFWHGDQLLMPWFFLYKRPDKDIKCHSLISQHADGRLIASVLSHLSLPSIAGSSTRGGQQAFRSMLRVLKRGGHVAITPDGPKGPRHKVKDGVIKLAQQSGRAVVPVSIAARKHWRFNSWDKMFLAKPFSSATMVVGELLYVPRNLSEVDFNEYKMLLERRLDEAYTKAWENEQ